MLLCATVCMVSCEKENGNDPEKKPVVYVAGTVETEKGHAATIWKDGVAITLTNKFTLTIPTGVCVDDNNDVYVTGYGSDADGNFVAIVWKNSVAINLSDGTNDSRAYSVFVSQNDVYVAGSEYNETNSIAKLWKNGVTTNLTPDGKYGTANRVFVK